MLDYQTQASQSLDHAVSSHGGSAALDWAEARRSSSAAPLLGDLSAARPGGASPVALAHWLTLSLDHVGRGMLLVTLGGRVLHANRLARSALSGGGPCAALRLQDGRLQARSVDEDKQLNNAIADALNKGLRRMLTFGRWPVAGALPSLGASAAGARAALLQGAVDGPFNVAVLPIDSGPAVAQGGVPGSKIQGQVALISLPQPCRTQDLAVQCWARQYGLTGAEIAVLQDLLAGMAPPAIARAKGVELCTVRSHIGKLRAKTESHTIRELLDRVAALPPMMGMLQ